MGSKRFILFVGITLLVFGFQTFAVGPNEVVLWTDQGYRGSSVSYTLESHMRHRLVWQVPHNDQYSSIEVGSNVSALICKHANFGGWSLIYTYSADIHWYVDDEISSIIVFPRSQDAPYGVELSDRKYTNSVTNKIPNRWFFPLPENSGHTEAEYPTVDSIINDDAAYILFQGEPHIEASLYEDANFTGKGQLTISNDPNRYGYVYYTSSYGVWFDLSHFIDSLDVKNKISSLKVRWTGSVNLPPMPPMPQVVERQAAVVWPDISGVWNSSYGYEYEIHQVDERFTWYNGKFAEHGDGVLLENERIRVEWSGTNGLGHDAGTLIYGRNGEVSEIVWDSGNVFFR